LFFESKLWPANLANLDQRDRMRTVTENSMPLLLLLRVNALQAWRRVLSLREQSRLLTTTIGLFIVGYLGLSFWLFYHGLKFVTTRFPGLGEVLAERLLYLLFAFLFALLLLSNLIICYTNFFRNREAAFLLTLPVPRRTIFQWKFIESILLASWAFLFLIAPLLGAFGLVRGVPWHFYAVTTFLVTLFIVLPGVAGAWLAMHVARYLDRRRFQIAVVGGSVVLLALAAFWWRAQSINDDTLGTRVSDVLDQLLAKTGFAQFPFLPGYWLSTSVLQWADGILSGAFFFMLVLLSYTLFFGYLAFTRFGNLFYDTASAVQSRASIFGRWKWFSSESKPAEVSVPSRGLLEKFLDLAGWLRSDVRALVVKDIRMFWRDTAQWGQSVMLFGLLGVYIINLRHFTSQLNSPFWVNLVSFLNLGACSLNLATVTTRFVYPQFSLEGRRLWIIGMAPMGLARVIKVKYWLASVSSLMVTLTLITLSSQLLRLSLDRLLFFSGAIAIMTFALNGLAAGLGVLFPNFKEGNPSKIVSGFGGTLCLVLSFLYILGSVLLLAFGTTGPHANAAWAAASITVFTLLSFCIGWLPVKLGLRQLKQFEV
jgi:ABC-2 type transport system permease protein